MQITTRLHRNVAEISNISKSIVENHLKALGYVSKLDVWIPRQIKEIHLVKCISDSLLKRMKNELSIITSIGKDREASVINQSKILQKKSFIKRRLCCQSGGIEKASCLLNCFQGLQRLIRVYIVDNWMN